eukprot:gb/GFBE01059091.1/.p1 GENE.gb/GFBE01059091.1/~~gb/GFBE01059091.1/.p1  ORF type:complete len:106 (+),score=13.11 gb/GFBE01059091.1/:1-318(+)
MKLFAMILLAMTSAAIASDTACGGESELPCGWEERALLKQTTSEQLRGSSADSFTCGECYGDCRSEATISACADCGGTVRYAPGDADGLGYTYCWCGSRQCRFGR